MNRLIAMLWAGLAVSAFAGAQFEVKNVEAHQRYPWNGKVDIDFLIDCADSAAEFDVTVECTDHIGGTNVMMKTIKKNDIGETATKFTLQKGQHRLVWNADVDCPNVKLANISFAVFAKLLGEDDTADYLIIDLSGGPDATAYPVSYRTGAPSDGWTDEYKTTKLVMRKCPAGKFINTEYAGGEVTLTKDFFAGVFEVTQKQWLLVMGTWPSSSPSSYFGVGDDYPAYNISYSHIRGSSNGSQWPASSAVDASSFVGKLRVKTGLNELDLPTEAQWECACRAGTATTYNTGDDEGALAAAGWYLGNAGDKSHPVGQKTENTWGLFDMHGNVSEWCLDRFGEGLNLSGIDPKGAMSGSYRRDRGGHWNMGAGSCKSSFRGASYLGASSADFSRGFRLFRTCP